MLPLGDSEVSPPWILCEQGSIVLVELCCVSSSGIGVRNNLVESPVHFIGCLAYSGFYSALTIGCILLEDVSDVPYVS